MSSTPTALPGRALRRRSPTRLLATAAAAALLAGLTACGGQDNQSATPGPDAPAVAEPEPTSESGLDPVDYADAFAGVRAAGAAMPRTAALLATAMAKSADISGEVSSPAAGTRAELTHLLTEHAYLTGLAAAVTYATSPDSAKAKSAIKALDANAVALAKAVGKLAKDAGVPKVTEAPDPDEADEETDGGSAAAEDPADEEQPTDEPGEESSGEPTVDARKAFLDGWRAHNEALLDYAVAAEEENESDKASALESLEAYGTEAGMFVREVTGGAISTRDVADSLVAGGASLTEAIDALAAGDGVDALKEAAGEAPETAALLAGAFADAADLEGDSGDDAADLRAGLTHTLGEHVYLASVAVVTAYTTDRGTTSKAYRVAAATLDDNSIDLSVALRPVADPQDEAQFLIAWRKHVKDFETYATGAANDDAELTEFALVSLADYRQSGAKFVKDVTDGAASTGAVSGRLTEHIETLTGAIDALRAALVPAASDES